MGPRPIPKKIVRLSRKKTLERLDDMTRAICEEASFAARAHAAFQGGNDAIRAYVDEHGRGPMFAGAECMNVLQASALYTVASTLGRLFDQGSARKHANEKDVASIPLVVLLLKQVRCQKEMQERAREWHSYMSHMAEIDAASAVEAAREAVMTYAALRRSSTGRSALATLKTFRNERLAHRLLPVLDKNLLRTERSKVGELEMLLGVATSFADKLSLAVTGHASDTKNSHRIRCRTARETWEMILPQGSPTSLIAH